MLDGATVNLRSYLLIITIGMIVPLVAKAEQWAFMGLGASSCADYALAFDARDSMLGYFSWAQGYMSAMNDAAKMASVNQKALNGIPEKGEQVEMRTYCGAHPNDRFVIAVEHLYEMLPDMNAN